MSSPSPLMRLLLAGALALLLISHLPACGADPDKEGVGVGITGIDHLADHVSVQDFWVNGYSANQAGKGGRMVCCATVPRKWQEGMTVHIRWGILNWRDHTTEKREATVPVDRYDEPGRMYVHFLSNGTVRVTVSNQGFDSPTYPGTHEPVPQKHPWDVYPWSRDEPASEAK